MTIITKEIQEAIDNLNEEKGKRYAYNYAEFVKMHESNISSLQKEQSDVSDFVNGEVFISANDTVKSLLIGRLEEIEIKISKNEKEKEQYFGWVKEHLEK